MQSGRAHVRGTLSIRVRLMLLASLAMLPLFAERIYNENYDRAERVEVAYRQALGLAHQGAAAQNEVLGSARALLQAVASARATFDVADDRCTRLLAEIARPIPWIRSLSVANLEGTITCSSFPDAIGLDISRRPHFAAAIKTADFVLSDYFVGIRLKTPAITAALAQTGTDGAAVAVVLGVLDLTWFERVARAFVPPSGSMVMVDGAGTVLARYPNRAEQVGRRLKQHPLVREMLARPEGLVTTAALDGVRRIFGYVQLPGTQARVAVGFDESEVLARANRKMWLALAELAAVAAIVLLGIWFGGERLLMRPIRALANTAARIGRGEAKTAATDLPWASEFVPLAVALDDMAAKLDAREQELRDTNMQLRELAQIDSLTGLANRRMFNERLMTEWKRAAKLRQPIAILMIDVDFFKLFNDRYGHMQGDACLRKVSGVLLAATRAQEGASIPAFDTEAPSAHPRVAARARPVDFAARHGGEEFAILLQGADLDVALRVGERLRAGVEDLLMAHIGAPWGFVSISVGAASVVPGEHDSPQELAESADAALYEAKRQGRNRVCGPVPAALSRAG